MPDLRQRRSRRAVVAAIVVVSALLIPSAASAAAVELLPDLRMAEPSQLHLERADGHYWLRFTTVIQNVGDGPLEVRSTRKCPDCAHMLVNQAVLRSDGGWNVRKTPTRQRYDDSDGHHHWHVMGMERYELFPLDAPFATGPLTGHKRGFCFFDGLQVNPAPTNARHRPKYSYYGCGFPSSQKLLVGLAVGWGDTYPYDFAGQYVDLAGVTPGDYLVCVTADPSNWFREMSNGNNAAWARVHIPAPDTLPDHSRTEVSAVSSGQQDCATQLPYDPGQPTRASSRGSSRASAVPGASGVSAAAPDPVSIRADFRPQLDCAIPA